MTRITIPTPGADGAPVSLFTLNGSSVYTGSDVTVSGTSTGTASTVDTVARTTADAAYAVAATGTVTASVASSSAYSALQTAWSGTQAATAATQTAWAGTATASTALQTAWSGTSTANTALQTGWAGTQSAASAYALAQTGTNAILSYVDRGDVAVNDFTFGSLTFDNAVRDLNFSTIVPSGVRLVNVRLAIMSNAALHYMNVFTKGYTHNVNLISMVTPAAGVWTSLTSPLYLDTNRLASYAGNVVTDAVIVVTGYWKTGP